MGFHPESSILQGLVMCEAFGLIYINFIQARAGIIKNDIRGQGSQGSEWVQRLICHLAQPCQGLARQCEEPTRQ